MSIGIFNVPAVRNEPVKNYAPGSPERELLTKALEEARAKTTQNPHNSPCPTSTSKISKKKST